jgi:hypothetical protein
LTGRFEAAPQNRQFIRATDELGRRHAAHSDIVTAVNSRVQPAVGNFTATAVACPNCTPEITTIRDVSSAARTYRCDS